MFSNPMEMRVRLMGNFKPRFPSTTWYALDQALSEQLIRLLQLELEYDFWVFMRGRRCAFVSIQGSFRLLTVFLYFGERLFVGCDND